MLRNSKAKSKIKITLKVIRSRTYTPRIRSHMQQNSVKSSWNLDGKGMRQKTEVDKLQERPKKSNLGFCLLPRRKTKQQEQKQ